VSSLPEALQESDSPQNISQYRHALTDILRSGARRLLALAVELEPKASLAGIQDLKPRNAIAPVIAVGDGSLRSWKALTRAIQAPLIVQWWPLEDSAWFLSSRLYPSPSCHGGVAVKNQLEKMSVAKTTGPAVAGPAWMAG